jgi:hypothetical protein
LLLPKVRPMVVRLGVSGVVSAALIVSVMCVRGRVWVEGVAMVVVVVVEDRSY